jgi:hypothetical protein
MSKENNTMLVDIPEGFEFLDSINPAKHQEVRAWRAQNVPSWQLPERIDTGLYWDPYGLFEHYAGSLVEDPFDLHKIDGDLGQRIAEARRRTAEDLPLENYGVCDSPDQVTARWRFLATAEEKYLITFAQHRRQRGAGWKWRKQGVYIGTQNPQCELLDDEPDIDQVLTFVIYRVIR